MSAWTCLIGWIRFTVPDSTVDEMIALVGGDWIKDQKGFQGYTQSWLSRGHAGGWSVRELIWKGHLPSVKVGRRVHLDYNDLNQFVDRHKVLEPLL
jgi:hypothetical protein